jgi:hypothetical protein
LAALLWSRRSLSAAPVVLRRQQGGALGPGLLGVIRTCKRHSLPELSMRNSPAALRRKKVRNTDWTTSGPSSWAASLRLSCCAARQVKRWA